MIPLLHAQTETQNWSRFRGADANGSWNPPSLPDNLEHLEPKRLWSQPIGKGFGGITLANGRIYVMDHINEDGKNIERVLCFSAKDGSLIWQHRYEVSYAGLEYESGPRASVTLHEGVAYAVGAKAHLHALDAANGQVLWSVDCEKVHQAKVPRWGVSASPVVWQNTLFLHVGAEPQGAVLALNLQDGSKLWQAGDDLAGYATPSLIATDPPQLIQWGPNRLMSLDPQTGDVHWQFDYPIQYGVSISQPIYRAPHLFISSYWHGARTFKLGPNTQDFELAWSSEQDIQGLMSQGLEKDGIVYKLDRNSGVTAFELATGNILWRDDHQFTPKDRNPQISLVWASKERNIAAGLNANGELFFAEFTADGFAELSRHQIIGKTWAHPAFDDRHIFARNNHELIAWQLW